MLGFMYVGYMFGHPSSPTQPYTYKPAHVRTSIFTPATTLFLPPPSGQNNAPSNVNTGTFDSTVFSVPKPKGRSVSAPQRSIPSPRLMGAATRVQFCPWICGVGGVDGMRGWLCVCAWPIVATGCSMHLTTYVYTHVHTCGRSPSPKGRTVTRSIKSGLAHRERRRAARLWAMGSKAST